MPTMNATYAPDPDTETLSGYVVLAATGIVLGRFTFEGQAREAAASLVRSVRRAQVHVSGLCPLETAYGYGGPTLYCNGKVHPTETWCREHQIEHGLLVRPYPAALTVMMDGWDGWDLYGSATSLGFALGDVATAMGWSAIGAALDYRPGMATFDLDDMALAYNDRDYDGDTTFEAACLAESVKAGDLDEGDLLLAARVVSRYLDAVKAAGLDY